MHIQEALLFVGAIAASVFGATAALTKGHDLSSVGIMETQQGANWLTTEGKNTTIESIFGGGGMDSVRLRIWTDGDYDLDYTLALAQRFSKAGYKIYLDMHFSDTWADPSDQSIPSSWDDTSVDTLAADLQAYVTSTLKSFTDGGVELDILSLGNEITNGFLYPIGKINNNDFSNFATLWKASRQGVADAVSAGTMQPKVMLHIDNGWKYETVSSFFEGLFKEGTVTTDDVDVFGFSFYPFYSTEATIDALTSSLTQIADTYKKPIYVAETDWPTECTKIKLSADYPVSARGQREWVIAIMDVLKGLPNGLGAGIFYWEPSYMSVPGLGSACESNLLFSVNWDEWPDTYAKALSSVYMFTESNSTEQQQGQAQQSQTTDSPVNQAQTEVVKQEDGSSMFAQTLLWTGACMVTVLGGVQALTKGHDLSSIPLMEKEKGATWYSTSGKEAAIENILGDGGMDSVRLRLWTGGEYTLDYTLALAQRFSKAGYKIYLDMHFSDTWADPSDQSIPSSWDDTSVDTLAADLQAYVTSTLKSFTDGGVELDILSLGNEITNGFLYPIGKINNNDFSNFATLWKASRQGVADAVSAGTMQPKVMLHIDNGWKYETVSSFFEGLFKEGTVTTDDVDVFGFSFYPFYSTEATIDALTSSLTQIADTYKKPIYVAETDWPTECTKVKLSADYPVSAEGQQQWVSAIMDVLEGLPNGLGAGIFYWEPAYLSVAGLGSSCESALLFSVNWDNWPETHATALSSVNMFAAGNTTRQ
ncbi:hypothetical protein BBP00_00005120 [Phytophthora kernoviae]|uniref:arabinogalactan endo-beta-1,4-galactanase n=2 Tax=Phytophthora kernoviae TaxID=325452 RepID=A0A3F2RPT4_9STRA|nr:hypothetical protein BBP00_00005120 [Phytophthora kernoviae]